ncbi:MAG: L-threonylcarbamoyladenylate synthase [Polyangia bacterium]|jgi:L-threonylcarbamoyladenylate synthase|nr:L-threonylcarbamoyladenylate synthase [Polyangia bacterium]
MKILKCDDLKKNPSLYREVATVLEEGGVVVFPGHSSYRLAVAALSEEAVAKLQQAKRRVQNTPALVFLKDRQQLSEFVDDLPEVARQLMATFWPGQLTIRFEPSEKVPSKIRKALAKATGKIGFRIPTSDVGREIVRAFGRPLLISSANRSKKSGAQSIAQVRKNFGNLADLILDDGDLAQGSSSTIVDVSSEGWSMVREGSISGRELTEKIGMPPT